MRIVLVYFSATNVTKTYAGVMGTELSGRGCEVLPVDVTSFSSRQDPLPLDGADGVLFGFPVYADFAPSVIQEWIPTLDGKGKRCATFFTYGARTTGYAHYHTKVLLENAGFRVQCTAEFLGRHTYNLTGWRVIPDRPDERDFSVAREFAALALERYTRGSPKEFELQKPFGYNTVLKWRGLVQRSPTGGLCHPVRFKSECRMCRRCETECPTRAFDADTGVANPLKCIECMHCVYICPDKVLKTDDRMKDAYSAFIAEWNLTERIINAKRSRIITEPWQAAQ